MRMLSVILLSGMFVGCEAVSQGGGVLPAGPSPFTPGPAVPGLRGQVTPLHQTSRPGEIVANPQCDTPEVTYCKALWLMSESWARQRTIVRIEIWKDGPFGGLQWVPYDVMTLQAGEREKDWRSRGDERASFRWFAVRVDPTSADTAFGFFSF